MKKQKLSPSIAHLVAAFEKNNEQSIATPPAQNTQKPSQTKRPEHLSHTRETTPHTPQTSEELQSQTTQGRTPPQRPPRARDKELLTKQKQEDEGVYATPAPPKPPRTRVDSVKQHQQEESPYATPTPKAAPRAQNPTTTQGDDPIYATPAPQKPPRTRGGSVKQQQQGESPYATPTPKAAPRAQNPTQAQDNEPIYAELEIKTPPSTSNRQRRGAITEQEHPIYATVASSGMTVSLSKEEMSLKIKNSPLIQACKDQIQALSETVYGNPNIFQEKLEEIEKNPILGESLSWQVAANPKLVGNFAGKKVLGVKNQARKEAEENITPLCLALENYAETVKQVRGNILQGHRAEQTLRRSSMDLRQMAEDLQKPRKAEQKMGPLSQKEMARRVQSSSMVQYCHAEIIYWCTVAYGDANILQYRLEEIQKVPEMAENLAWQVTEHPDTFGKLAGRSLYSLKSEARKQAESALPRLGEAIEGYAEAIKQAKENISQSQEAKQQRHAQPPQQEQSRQQQQSLSEAPQLPKRPSTHRHQARVESSMQTEQSPQTVQPRTTLAPEQQRQESAPSSSPTQTKRRAPLPPQEQSAQRQQSLSESPEVPKRSSTHQHQGVSRTSMQTEQSPQAVRSRTTLAPEQQRQESALSSSPTRTKRHAPPPPQEQSAQRQQSLSESPEVPKRSSTQQHQAAAASPSQAHWEKLGAKPRTTRLPEQQRQEGAPSSSPTQTKRRAPLPPQEQSPQRQQSLSESPEIPKRSSTHQHQGISGTSMQTEQSPQAVRPRMVRAPQTKSPSSLSLKEIAAKVQSDLSVQRALIEVYNHSNIVYGNPFVFKYQAEDIQKIPVLGEELSWQVANYPKIFASLSGRQMLGIKNDARKHAEEAIPSLCSAIDHYTETIKKVRKEIVKTHEEQQKLQGQSSQQEQSMQKQQSLSESPQTPERSARDRHQEASEKSMQAEKSLQAARSRKTESSKAMALSG
ncbi:BID domain-containing T4SS effector [Bartonella sp. ML70XJBT.G]|uniref:BID domain-containing T4SS effector n=1 Tax=Bartonella sp. ML70XJBT.G TaxID=3019093 RepID=UPI00236255F7|nr:BID domain-containing T4SS effector [Bartonella sp. ML70XJBT.G]